MARRRANKTNGLTPAMLRAFAELDEDDDVIVEEVSEAEAEYQALQRSGCKRSRVFEPTFDAYAEGHDAAEKGRAVDTNPYIGDDDVERLWRMGWEHYHEDKHKFSD